LGFRVQGFIRRIALPSKLSCRIALPSEIKGLEIRVQGSGFRVWRFGMRVQVAGFHTLHHPAIRGVCRIALPSDLQDLEMWVQGSGFRV